MISSFKELEQFATTCKPESVAVAGGNDINVLKAIDLAIQNDAVKRALITGDPDFIRDNASQYSSKSIEAIKADDNTTCSFKAVEAIRESSADILIKGSVDSTSFLRAIVDKKTGIRGNGILSNITVAEMESIDGFLAATDNGIMPHPDFEQKKQIVLNTRHLYRGLGYSEVKVAAIAATEKVSEKLPSTMDAAHLKTLSQSGEFSNFVIDGPFGYDVAVSQSAAKAKGLEHSPVAGKADLILFPTIDAANAVVKSWKYHGGAQTGSIVLGAKVPILLNSRSDSAERRINALMLAIAEAHGREASK